MFCHVLRFGFDASDMGFLVALLLIFFYCILIGRHIENKKPLFKLFLGFFAGTMIFEVFFNLFKRRGAQMILLALQFLSMPACLAFGLCFLVRYIQGRKKE